MKRYDAVDTVRERESREGKDWIGLNVKCEEKRNQIASHPDSSHNQWLGGGKNIDVTMQISHVME